jgi:hypothetical protein
MGRRSRKRGGAPAPAPAPRAAAAPPRRRPRPDERPKAPWHPFPLVELCVLLGLVMFVLGALDLQSDRGRLLLVCGMVLGSLGGLDTAAREHFAGYRSHTTVLSGLPAVLVAGALFFVRAPWLAIALAAALTFTAAFTALRRAYRRRAGVH